QREPPPASRPLDGPQREEQNRGDSRLSALGTRSSTHRGASSQRGVPIRKGSRSPMTIVGDRPAMIKAPRGLGESFCRPIALCLDQAKHLQLSVREPFVE